MAITVAVDGEHGVLLAYDGPATVAELEAAIDEGNGLAVRIGAHYSITDCRRAVLGTATMEDAHRVARQVARGPLAPRGGRLARVGPPAWDLQGEFEFFLTRWLAPDVEMQGFDDIDDARAWASASRLATRSGRP